MADYRSPGAAMSENQATILQPKKLSPLTEITAATKEIMTRQQTMGSKILWFFKFNIYFCLF